MSNKLTSNGGLEFLYGWIDAHAAMTHLGLGSLSALYSLIREHRLPFGRIGRHYRFRRADLDEWAAVRTPETMRQIERANRRP